jgi:hypoxanthine phosphoribosyltransferase
MLKCTRDGCQTGSFKVSDSSVSIPRSEEIVSAETVQATLDRLAKDITARLADRNPLVIAVLNGGLVFAGQLLPRLPFALEIGYVHVRRYGRETRGGELVWIAGPQEPVSGRTVLLLDDILDEGETLLAIRSRLYELGATEVLLAAFAVKTRKELPRVVADFTGLRVPDRFVFGFGMDVGGRWRNLPSIRALTENAD